MMTHATKQQIVDALTAALDSSHVRSARSWDKGGVALELARTALSKQGLSMPGASFDEDVIEIDSMGIVVEIR